MADDELQERIEDLLEAFGWKQTEGESLVGFTIAIHSVQEGNDDTLACEVIYFGTPEFRHDSLHALSDTTDHMVEADHAKQGLYN